MLCYRDDLAEANRERAISGLRRVSKPGLRVYAKKDNLPRVLGGLGVAIISTSHGLMTDKQAKKRGVGGEVLAYVPHEAFVFYGLSFSELDKRSE